jgi:hypothetical protein
VQGRFHRAANHFSQVRLNLVLIDLHHLAELRYFLAYFALAAGLHRRFSSGLSLPSFTNQIYLSSNVRKTLDATLCNRLPTGWLLAVTKDRSPSLQETNDLGVVLGLRYTVGN